ncbi:hypothetical protein [Collinsella intestinalis]|uniref:hypothetical protein n=1 Tax=Collinsella intestinalis TaxID=147207 RepID=UPI00195C8E49|nr:hypothetical protein [Collinsella intestinalis]MBM6907890.1 hypothetical protein [Collinsella intestinalis]MBM6943410.1 hypothetical protein [Collinsella intestinalis]
MSRAQTYIEDLIYECSCIVAGDYGDETQEHIDDLMLAMEGFSFQLRVTGAIGYLRMRNVDGVKRVKGWLICNMANLAGQPPATMTTNLQNVGNASSSSTSTANATVTISHALDALESCSLSPEELSEMKAAIADLEAAKGKAPETLCEKASRLLDLAKKGADTAKALAPYVASALATLGTIL